MVLDPIPQSLPVHFFGSRPQPPTSPRLLRIVSSGCCARVSPFAQTEFLKKSAPQSSYTVHGTNKWLLRMKFFPRATTVSLFARVKCHKKSTSQSFYRVRVMKRWVLRISSSGYHCMCVSPFAQVEFLKKSALQSFYTVYSIKRGAFWEFLPRATTACASHPLRGLHFSKSQFYSHFTQCIW